MITIENMDADHEIRRISPVAVSSNDGYTDLLNGCMDKGWLVQRNRNTIGLNHDLHQIIEYFL